MDMIASFMAGKAAMGLLWAPPRGSGITASITPKFTSSGAVIFSASVACSCDIAPHVVRASQLVKAPDDACEHAGNSGAETIGTGVHL